MRAEVEEGVRAAQSSKAASQAAAACTSHPPKVDAGVEYSISGDPSALIAEDTAARAQLMNQSRPNVMEGSAKTVAEVHL